MNTTTNTEFDVSEYIGEKIVIDGEIRTVISIKGRWVKISDGRNISREEMIEGRDEYLEDLDTLGDELDDEAVEQELEESPEVEESEEIDEKSVVKKKYREGYDKVKRADGRRSMDNGDRVSIALRNLSGEGIKRIVEKFSPESVGRWDHLNIGMRSMNGRNMLRRLVKQGKVTIAYLESF
jgi:hypothetical protein